MTRLQPTSTLQDAIFKDHVMQQKMAAYTHCELCRRHHSEGRRHIYQKKHKERLKEVLEKFSEKTRSARRLLPRPQVVEGELEPGACLWCYCCSEEVERHRTDREVTVVWGGLLEHMGSAVHLKKTRQFLYDHGAEQLVAGQLTVTEEELGQFKAHVGVALDKMAASKEQERERLAALIREKEVSQQSVAMEPPPAVCLEPAGVVYRTVRNKHGVMQNPTGRHEELRVWGGGVVKYRPSSDQLLQWDIDSLTDRLYLPHKSVAMPTSAAPGNIHTGAVPPWLREDEEQQQVGLAEIGPSEEEFRIHKEKLSQLSKNPKRVGANFRHEVAMGTSEDWLPSFGQVWSFGPRSQSKLNFRRDRRTAVMPSASSARPAPSRSESSSKQEVGVAYEARPYTRKRRKLTPDLHN